MNLRAVLLTGLAMIAFAGNSLLCRFALGQQLIDPASFSTVRVVSGAATLWVIVLLRRAPASRGGGSWRSAYMLFAYMVFFSFAYTLLGAATGALILFGTVQITMFAVALRSGERLAVVSWMGLALAVGGLAYLLLPGATAPDPLGAGLMAVAGAAWGFYTLLGRRASDPIGATTRSFVYAAPMTMAVSFVFLRDFDISGAGLALALASGAITSACGYAIWYAALKNLSATRAAIVQLSVPVIAALGAIMLLSEPATPRLALASIATLGGITLAMAPRWSRRSQS